MKENYQLKQDIIINSLTNTPSLLLHSCCAPCSSYCIEYLSNYFNITVYYYNPNIDTNEEYNKRKYEQQKFIKQFKTKNPVNFIEEQYDNDKYIEVVKGLENEVEGSMRCYKCYHMRMRKTALYAKDNNFDYFATTLTLSPYKNSTWVNEIGKNLEQELEIKYLYSDFKKKNGYKRSIELSKEYNLYRQDYCGCIFSKNARKR